MSWLRSTVLRRAIGTREMLLVAVNAAIFIFLTVMSPEAFASWTNIKAVLSLMTYDLLLAVAMTVVLIVRGLDLSVGSVMALASVVMALLLREGTPVVPALATGLGVALICGFINGFLVAKGGILPFLVTLGMMSVARGFATVLTTGQYISFPRAERWFTQFGRFEFRLQIGNGFYGIPLPLIIVLATIAVFAGLLGHWAVLRRAFYVGESPEAANLSGIRVDRYVIGSYMIAAVFVWLAAVLMTSANRIGYANYGIGAELRALAAAIVGGASMAGGAGSILGSFLGVLMLALIGNGFVLLNGNPNWQQATVGLVLIAAVGFDAVRTYRTRR
ncbi:MAG: ABC transporter permease [Hyphomicrobiales bacterium]|nr:MAG: ABC transporter permease [Hyphomicrobiales bacterium]